MTARWVRLSLSLLVLACLVLGALLAVERARRQTAEKDLREAQNTVRRISGQTLTSPSFEHWHLDQMRIADLPAADPSLFSKQPLLEAGIEDFAGLVVAARARFAEVRDPLRATWGIEDEPTLEALFYLNLVASMWGYGNPPPDDYADPGCATINRATGDRRLPAPTVRTYLETEVGCCEDSAFLLGVLLDGAGIRSRRVFVLDHAFNEAELDGCWVVLDPTLDLWFHSSWEEIQNRVGEARNAFTVTVFPHPNLVEPGNPDYRPRIGQLRLAWLLRAIKQTAPGAQYAPAGLSAPVEAELRGGLREGVPKVAESPAP